MADKCNCCCPSGKKIIKTTFLLRRGTTAAWEEANPVLAYGEPGYEKDTGKLKIGDGDTPWSQLPYVGDGDSVLEVDNQSIEINEEGKVSLYGFSDAEIGQMPIIGQDGNLEWIAMPSVEQLQELEERVDAVEEAINFEDNIYIIYGGSADDVIVEPNI